MGRCGAKVSESLAEIARGVMVRMVARREQNTGGFEGWRDRDRVDPSAEVK